MSLRHRIVSAMSATGLLLALLPGATAGADPSAATPSDFNGDGYVDLAIGVPKEDIGTRRDAGGVNVLYASAGGLTAAGNQFWSQDSAGVLEASEASDLFGTAVASGDFDGDGYADLAVGAPGENIGTMHDTGSVNVLYGDADGLAAAGTQLWTASDFVESGADVGYMRFGRALAAGDFDGDGFADLAIGAGGAVAILIGSPEGLSLADATRVTTATPGIPGGARPNDFGRSLATGDLDGDGFADLAVGAPAGDDEQDVGVAAVYVLYGTSAGLSAEGSQLWNQASPGIADEPEHRPLEDKPFYTQELFGSALAIGDFDADGSDDLAIGVPRELFVRCDRTNPEWCFCGAVNVIYGSPAGLTAEGSQFWHQNSPGVPGTRESDDAFGAALAAGDLDGDGQADLAIGAPRESLGSVANAGNVTILYGSTAGLTASGSQSWSQNSPGVPGPAESRDYFGASLAIADHGRSHAADLAVGVPGENVGAVVNAGIVDVLYGRSTGLSGTNAQSWSQRTTGVLGVAETSDVFGSSLAR